MPTLSTNPMPANQGLPEWLSMWGSLLGGSQPARMHADSLGARLFNGQIAHSTIGRVKLCRVVASQHRVSLQSACTPNPDRGYKAVVQVRGTSTFEQSGRSVTIRPGEWTIYDAIEPYCLINHEDVEQHIAVLPRDLLGESRFQMKSLTAQRLLARTGIGRIACDLLRVSLEEISLNHLVATDAVESSLSQLFQQSILEHSSVIACFSRADHLRDKIKTHIKNNLRCPNLSIDQLATSLNQSKRNLHRVFAAEGTTINSYIWAMRLEQGKRDLANPALSHFPITRIAHHCGFSSSAHFSRSFKQSFGMCPSDYRHHHFTQELAPAHSSVN